MGAGSEVRAESRAAGSRYTIARRRKFRNTFATKNMMRPSKGSPPGHVMILGVGSFAHSIGGALAGAGADISTYLTRDYGHFPPSLVGRTFVRETFPSPVPLIQEHQADCVIPQSIDWAHATVGGGVC